jgi:hypothetical protein
VHVHVGVHVRVHVHVHEHEHVHEHGHEHVHVHVHMHFPVDVHADGMQSYDGSTNAAKGCMAISRVPRKTTRPPARLVDYHLEHGVKFAQLSGRFRHTTPLNQPMPPSPMRMPLTKIT